jgi:hypothetical protein
MFFWYEGFVHDGVHEHLQVREPSEAISIVRLVCRQCRRRGERHHLGKINQNK